MHGDPSFLPAATAADTVEALLASHGRSRDWIHGLLAATVAAILAALPLVEVDVTIRTPGIVRPVSGLAEVRAAAGGRLAECLVQDNERVSSGQALFAVQTPDLDERLARHHRLAAAAEAVIADLEALVALLPAADATPPPGTAVPIATAGLPGPLSSALRTSALRGELAELATRLETSRLAEARARVELDRATTLAARGIASRRELDDARYALSRTQADGQLILQQALARWHSRLRDERLALDGLRSESSRLTHERAAAKIVSPTTGTVRTRPGLRVGSMVASGETLATVSPADRLVVETVVSPRDIGRVRPGQSVRLHLDAFPAVHWGHLDGIVSQIADDLSASDHAPPAPDGGLGFKVVILPAATGIRRADGAMAPLGKGQTVQARLSVGRRSLFALLREGTAAWLDPRAPASPS